MEMVYSENNYEEDLSSTTSSKKNRCRSFHFRYLELCRSKNHAPASEIKCKNKATSILDFYGDKIKAEDWLMLVDSLQSDTVLQNIAIRLRKLYGNVEFIDTEKGAKLFKNKPPIYTRFIFNGFIKSLTNCITYSKSLTSLCLEALPLNEQSVVTIAKAISLNEQLKSISFQRSSMGDKACEIICNTVKYLANIENLNMSQCDLSLAGALHITDLIKFQKIFRYSEGWKKSLRYREVDADSIPGLKTVFIGHNPGIGDKGLAEICEILKEDVWIKVMDLEACGITDIGANCIIKCLELNKHIVDFNVRNNSDVSRYLLQNIEVLLGKDEEETKEQALHPRERKKIAFKKIKDRSKFLEEQIENERLLRKQVEQLNEQLHQQIMDYAKQIAILQGEQPPIETPISVEPEIPEGCVLIGRDELECLIRERDELKNKFTEPKQSKSKLRFKKAVKLRKAKSEIKYAEPSQKKPMRNKNCKSVHEFAEIRQTASQLKARSEHVYVETNIGDGSNTPCSTLNSKRLTHRQRSDNSYMESSMGDGFDTTSNNTTQRAKIKTSIYLDTRGGSESNRSASSNSSSKTVVKSTNNKYNQKLSNQSKKAIDNVPSPKNSNEGSKSGGKSIEEMIRIFVRKKQCMEANFVNEKQIETSPSPRSLFMGSSR